MSSPLGPVEKRKALSFVENSETFARQDQLKAFLRFVCEYEISGRGAELHEYLIGTEVFGQKDGYSTAENSVVRRRAHSLRHKLLDLYAAEENEDQVRILLPKGSYRPQFVSKSIATTASLVPQEEGLELLSPRWEKPPEEERRWRPVVAIWMAAVAACLLSGLIGFKLARPTSEAGVPPIVREVWGPILNPGAEPIVCIATNAQLQLFALPEGSTDAPDVAKLPEVRAWYSEHYRPLGADHLYYYANSSTPVWGDAAGGVFVSRMLTRAKVDFQLLPERVLDPFVLRDRNLVLLGRPANSPTANLLLGGLFYNMKWFADIKEMEVFTVDPKDHSETHLVHRKNSIHGLITVISSKSREGAAIQAVIISGTNSAGTLGAIEFFTSAERLQELKDRLLQDGHRHWPKTYQVLVSTEATSESAQFLPFKSSLESYRVIEQ